MNDDTKCSFVNEDGQRCKGTRVKATGMCPGHSGLGLARDREAASQAGSLSGKTRLDQAEARSEASVGSFKEALERSARWMAAAERLWDIVEHGSDADSIRALQSIADRLLGKPKETVVTEVEMPETIEAFRRMTPDEQIEVVRKLEEQGRLRVIHGGAEA